MFVTRMRTKATAVAGLMCLTVLGVGAALPEPMTPLRAAHLEAENWVVRNRSTLPKHLNELAELPMVTRKKVSANWTAAEKEQVWREQLETFVTPEAKLSPIQRRMLKSLSVALNNDQRQMIRGVLDSLHVGMGEGRTLEERAQFSRKVCTAAKKGFAAADGQLIFVTLGPIDSSYFHLISSTKAQQANVFAWSTAVIRYGAVKLNLRKPSVTPCFCNQDDCSWCDGCTISQCCVQSFPPCTEVLIPDCGCLGGQSCDGGLCT
jgi:hypothetical protein